MDLVNRARAAIRRRQALRRAARLAREAALVLQERNQAPLCSMRRMGLTARAMELNCLSCAAAAEAVDDQVMAVEHRVEADFFGRRARLHATLGASA